MGWAYAEYKVMPKKPFLAMTFHFFSIFSHFFSNLLLFFFRRNTYVSGDSSFDAENFQLSGHVWVCRGIISGIFSMGRRSRPIEKIVLCFSTRRLRTEMVGRERIVGLPRCDGSGGCTPWASSWGGASQYFVVYFPAKKGASLGSSARVISRRASGPGKMGRK